MVTESLTMQTQRPDLELAAQGYERVMLLWFEVREAQTKLPGGWDPKAEPDLPDQLEFQEKVYDRYRKLIWDEAAASLLEAVPTKPLPPETTPAEVLSYAFMQINAEIEALVRLRDALTAPPGDAA